MRIIKLINYNGYLKKKVILEGIKENKKNAKKKSNFLVNAIISLKLFKGTYAKSISHESSK